MLKVDVWLSPPFYIWDNKLSHTQPHSIVLIQTNQLSHIYTYYNIWLEKSNYMNIIFNLEHKSNNDLFQNEWLNLLIKK